MKILQINKLYYPWIGGVEKIVQEIAEGINKDDDLEISVLCCQPKGRKAEELINGVRVVKSPSLGIFWGMPVSFGFLKDFKREAEKADVLHFHEPFPLGVFAWWLFRPKKKIVVTYHSDIVRQKVILPFYKPILRKFLRAADVICPTSGRLVEYSYVLPEFKSKICVIPLGIDLQRFQKLSLRQNRKLNELRKEYGQEPFLLFVGRPNYYKGLDTLFEALKEVPAKLILVGTKESDVIFPLGIKERLIFAGRVVEEDLSTFYHLADIFVLPSTYPSEAFGLVQVEAMAAGLPVINTNLPTGVPWVSQHKKTGLTVEPGNARDLRDAIIQLLKNKKLRMKLGRGAKKRARLFTGEKMIVGYEKLYKSFKD